MYFWVCVFIRRDSLPVSDCWCGDDVSGDSGTVPAVLPGTSVSQQYKSGVQVRHCKDFYTTQQPPYIVKTYITIASPLPARIWFFLSTRCNCLIAYMHCVYITVEKAAYCTRVLRTICKFLSCQFQDVVFNSVVVPLVQQYVITERCVHWVCSFRWGGFFKTTLPSL